MKYAYEVKGAAAHGQTWEAKGEVEGTPGGMLTVATSVMSASFDALTGGQAVYGRPGVGCDGPYRITRMMIEEKGE
jgi:hypothetical protein